MVVMDSGSVCSASSPSSGGVGTTPAAMRSSWYDQQQQHQPDQDLADVYFKGQQSYFSQMQQVGAAAAYQGMSHGACACKWEGGGKIKDERERDHIKLR